MSFINKVVLVTGAGSGIGEAIAIHFAKLSARLSLVDIDAENLRKTADVCEQISRVKVLTTVADLCKDNDVKQAVDDTVKEFGRIDVVISCAGIYKPGSVLDSDLIEVFDHVMATNLRSVVCLTNLTAPLLEETKGCIVNISSSTSIPCAIQSIPYSAAIAALNHFTTSIALDLSSKGVRVNSILPGIVKTNILQNSGMNDEETEEFYNKASTPLKRILQCDEIAELAAFLASDKARAMTGGSYQIDAGLALK
ncbi:putative oxidoreductase YxbG [Anticarsia gemmatalis]|uniref:putative oxidoreductase YxbG n=1 Tax=Anticarsia gemmatalis TaxID=129554 RepID=UPI003F7626ED